MKDKLRKKVKEILVNKEVDAFLGLRFYLNHPQPYLFTLKNIDDLDQLSVAEVKYPIAKIYLKIIAGYPDKKFAIFVRGCDERHLIELHKYRQIDMKNILLIGANCTPQLAWKCKCSAPYTKVCKIIFGKRQEVKEFPEEKTIDFSSWMEKFSRCIKCYGCRYICPICFCNGCSLEEELIVKKGYLPVDYPVFHLVRAYHLAGRCVECGLCEDVCPAGIPLRRLYKTIARRFFEIFGYRPGQDIKERSPLEFLDEEVSNK